MRQNPPWYSHHRYGSESISNGGHELLACFALIHRPLLIPQTGLRLFCWILFEPSFHPEFDWIVRLSHGCTPQIRPLPFRLSESPLPTRSKSPTQSSFSGDGPSKGRSVLQLPADFLDLVYFCFELGDKTPSRDLLRQSRRSHRFWGFFSSKPTMPFLGCANIPASGAMECSANFPV